MAFVTHEPSRREWIAIGAATLIVTGAISVLLYLTARIFAPASGAMLLGSALVPILFVGPAVFLFLVRLVELRVANRKLATLAVSDSLTGILNRSAFQAVCERALDAAGEVDAPCALLIADADHFKRVNDSLGHQAGDAALRMIADAIGSQLRDGDLVGRLGGEEFGIFLADVENADALRVAERIREKVATCQLTARGTSIQLAISVGGATAGPGGRFDELYRRADHALYAAKLKGRNRVEFQARRDPPPLAA